MAMNIHQEARRKQMFMDRVCEARRRMALSQDEQQGEAGTSGGIQTDSVMCTDQGQFYQTRDETYEERDEAKPKRHWNRPKKIRQKSPEPKSCPPSLQGVERDKIYKILHPHTLY